MEARKRAKKKGGGLVGLGGRVENEEGGDDDQRQEAQGDEGPPVRRGQGLVHLAFRILGPLGLGPEGFGMGLRDFLILLQNPFPHILVVPVEFPLHPADFKVGFHPGLDFLQLERFRHVVHPAGGEGLHFIERFVVAADEQDGDIGELRVFFQLAARFVSVHSGHIHVQQDEVGRDAPGGLEREFPAGDRAGFVTFFLQHPREKLQVGRHVIHDKDVGFSRGFQGWIHGFRISNPIRLKEPSKALKTATTSGSKWLPLPSRMMRHASSWLEGGW